VYLADGGGDRIQMFDSDGAFLTKWGTNGSDAGQFYYPTGLAIDSSGNLYVVDQNNHRVQKFGPPPLEIFVGEEEPPVGR
jgi:DNA-binding beta-propeller fold protein YncE